MTCSVCNRNGLVLIGHAQHRRLAFHWAPCGLPCEGGYIGSEERTYHKRTHSENCFLSRVDPMVQARARTA